MCGCLPHIITVCLHVLSFCPTIYLYCSRLMCIEVRMVALHYTGLEP